MKVKGTIQELIAFLQGLDLHKNSVTSAQLEIQLVDAPVNEEVCRKPEKEQPPVPISGDSAILVKSLCTFLGVAPETDSRFDLIDVIEDVLYLLPEGGSISVKATAKTLRDRLRHAGFNLSPSRSKNFVEDYILPYLRGSQCLGK